MMENIFIKNICDIIKMKKNKLSIKIGGKMSLINVKNLTFGYDGRYKNIFEEVSFNTSLELSLF